MADVFISYARGDLEFVRELHAALVSHDKDIWVDWEDIPITAEWLAEVFQGIESSDNFLFVITPDSLASDVCAQELAHAVEKNKRLVPVLRRDAAPGTTMPPALAARNWTFFRPDDDFPAAVEALVEALDTDLDWVRAHTRLLGRSLEWEKRDRDASFLLRGRDLDDAEQWTAARSAEREPQPTALQLEYVLASRSAATRRQRITVGAALVAVVVAASLAVLAWLQRNEAVEQQAVAERQARLALSRQLAAQSEAALAQDPEQSVVLAARAATTAATDEARDQLRRALRGSRLRSVIDAGEPLRGAALDGEGRLVAAALESGGVGVWNLRTGRRLTTLRSAAQPARSASLSRDGSRALGVGEGGVAVWPVAPGVQTPLATFGRANRPLAAVFSPTADLVATGDLDGVVRLWRASTGAPQGELRVPGEPAPVTGVAFSGDGSRLAAARGSQTAVWSVRTGSRLFLRSQKDDVQAIAFAPGGGRVAAGDTVGVTRVWSLRTGEAVEVRGHEGTITGLAFSPDGASFVTASEDETGGIWDAGTGASIAELRGHRGLVLGADFAPDGRTVVTGSTDGTIRLWGVASDPVEAVLVAPTGKRLRDVGFAPDGTRLVTASEDLTARVWDLRRRRVLHVLPHGRGEDKWVESARFSRDGRHVVTAGDDGTAQVWRATSGAPLATLGEQGGPALFDAAFSPDGRLVAAGGQHADVRIWRWRERKLVRGLSGFTRVDGVAFSPGGALVAAAGGNTLRIWRVADGAQILSASTGERQDGLTSVAFDPAGKHVAVGSSSGVVWLWDRRGRKRLTRLAGNGDAVTDVSFDAGGRYLVAVLAHRGTANVWSVPRGQLVTTLRTRAPSLEGAAFAPSGRRVAVAGAGGRVTVFDCAECRPLRSLVCLASARVTPRVRAQESNAFASCD
jgi:WD40 repeat protein